MLTGGCYCGAVRFEVHGPTSCETVCHCSICRRTTGAPAVAWFTAADREFRFVQGRPSRFRSTEQGTRSFCPDCGTQLTFQRDDLADEIDVTTCSLDEPERAPPKDHTYMHSKLAWVRFADGLPEYTESRDQP